MIRQFNLKWWLLTLLTLAFATVLGAASATSATATPDNFDADSVVTIGNEMLAADVTSDDDNADPAKSIVQTDATWHADVSTTGKYADRKSRPATQPCTGFWISNTGDLALPTKCATHSATGRQLLMQQNPGKDVRVYAPSGATVMVWQPLSVAGSCVSTPRPAYQVGALAPENGDLSIFHVETHGCATAPLYLAEDPAATMDDVHIIGYDRASTQATMANGVTYGVKGDPYQDIFSAGASTSIVPKGNYDMVKLDKSLPVTMLGAPVLDIDYNVVSMVVINNDGGYAYGTSLSIMQRLFKQYDIAGNPDNDEENSALTASSSDTDQPNIKVRWLIAFGILATCLIIGLLFWIGIMLYRILPWAHNIMAGANGGTILVTSNDDPPADPTIPNQQPRRDT